ncbi:hypothetical protein EEB13_02965 [Rhodococcus sp. WS3]|uniref:hypothetical protein n=1 Tax=Rhodococcus sp. WS3 TaxID=2486271 RepID=UPI0011426A13|nr:hypothetical protein [Rhodococcus sp. WS3]ROZ48945.1 hypothetical protein EEB13_02965 [Rhodococcus sp. WS3]
MSVTTFFRWVWVVLALAAAALGYFAASDPMYQITSCEIGIFPSDGITNWTQCNESIVSYLGVAILAWLAVPALMCVIPAVVPCRWVAVTVAAILVFGAFGAFFASRPHLVAYGYFIPIALAACFVAALQWNRTQGNITQGNRSTREVSVSARF